MSKEYIKHIMSYETQLFSMDTIILFNNLQL